MANDIGAGLLSPALWSARTQVLLKNSLVAGAIANMEERANLKFGYRTHRPYTGDVYAADYAKGVAPTFQDMNATDEYLDVDQAKIIPIYIDDIDKIQNKYDALDKYTMRASYQVRNQIDQAVLGEVSNALLGNDTAEAIDTTNVFRKFSEAKAALFNNGVEDTKAWYAVVDPDTISIIEQMKAFNGFKTSDDVIENGYGVSSYVGDWQGLKMFRSQNLPSTLDIVFTDDPTGDTTLIINGVTFTFKAALGATAGNVLVDAASDVDVTIGTNLVAAINGSDGAGTTYVALSQNDRAKLKAQGITASYAADTNTLTLGGFGKMIIGGTQDTGTAGDQTMSLLVGQMGAIDLVIQKDVETEILRVTDGRKGYNATVFALYGKKMFREGAQRTYKLDIIK